MDNRIFCLIIFIVFYLIFVVTVILRKKQLSKFMNGTEVTYLKRRYKLSLKSINEKTMAHIIGLTNAFIISFTLFMTYLVNNLILKLLIAFIILIPLIITVYHIIGTILRKKER